MVDTHVVPLSTEYSYLVISEPLLSPAVKWTGSHTPFQTNSWTRTGASGTSRATKVTAAELAPTPILFTARNFNECVVFRANPVSTIGALLSV